MFIYHHDSSKIFKDLGAFFIKPISWPLKSPHVNYNFSGKENLFLAPSGGPHLTSYCPCGGSTKLL